MLLKRFDLLAYIFLLSSIKFIKAFQQPDLYTILMEDDFSPSEGQTELPEIKNVVQLEINSPQIQEELKTLFTATMAKIEIAFSALANDNKDSLKKHIRSTIDQIFEEKIQRIDQTLKDNLKLIEKESQYTVQEVKCDDRLTRDCKEINECNKNIYSVMVPEFSKDIFPVVCDLETLDGGWTIIQRRQDGTEDFFRNWTEYVNGFGNLNGEFFIGLEKLHALTTRGKPQELYIIVEDFEGIREYAKYGLFKVGSEQTGYNLTIDNYTGTAGDSLSYHNGCKFSTKDRDNDESEEKHCAQKHTGAWWYRSCYMSSLNGMYLEGRLPKSKSAKGMSWNTFRGYDYSLKFAQMMIREKED